MDAHFKDAFANQLTIAEIAMFDGSDTKDDPGAPHLVLQVGKQASNSSERSKVFIRHSVSDWITICNPDLVVLSSGDLTKALQYIHSKLTSKFYCDTISIMGSRP